MQKEISELNETVWSWDIKRKLMELDKELDGALALDEFYWKQRS